MNKIEAEAYFHYQCLFATLDVVIDKGNQKHGQRKMKG